MQLPAKGLRHRRVAGLRDWPRSALRQWPTHHQCRSRQWGATPQSLQRVLGDFHLQPHLFPPQRQQRSSGSCRGVQSPQQV